MKISARFFLIFLLILLVLPALGAQECSFSEGFVYFEATLDGKSWSGPISFSIVANEATGFPPKRINESLSSVPKGFLGKAIMYTVTYESGGPQGADIQFSGIRAMSDPKSTYKFDSFSPQPQIVVSLYNEILSFVTFTFVSVGNIAVKATLDGAPWEGPVSYTIEGPELGAGSIVPQSFSDLPVGTYTINYNSGGPPGAIFLGVKPSARESLSAGETATFTSVFVSVGNIAVKATLDGAPWEGPVSYTIEGPELGAGSIVPQSFIDLPIGTYTINYNSGGPPYAELKEILPSARGNLSAGETATFTSVFVSVGNIAVNATLDGVPWEGPVSYTIEGPELGSGSIVPQSFSDVPVGTYTINYNSGGPPYAELKEILPSARESLSAGETATFTSVFVSVGNIAVKATLDGVPWEGPVSYTIEGPELGAGSIVPQSFIDLPIGTYTITYDSGGPPGAIFLGVKPSARENLSAGETVTFTLVFVSPTGGGSYPAAPGAAPSADLSLTKTVCCPPYVGGGYATYTITVTNNGPSAATNILVTDNVTAGVDYFSDNATQGTYDPPTHLWDVGDIANLAIATLELTVSIVVPDGDITNTAEVTSVDQADPDSTPNNHILAEDDQASVTFTVGGGVP